MIGRADLLRPVVIDRAVAVERRVDCRDPARVVVRDGVVRKQCRRDCVRIVAVRDTAQPIPRVVSKRRPKGRIDSARVLAPLDAF